MSNKLKIYLLSSCDEWKSYKSMSLVIATTNIEKIERQVIKEIMQGNMYYRRGNESISRKNQSKLLQLDWREKGYQFAIDNLEHGYVNEVLDGEVQ